MRLLGKSDPLSVEPYKPLKDFIDERETEVEVSNSATAADIIFIHHTFTPSSSSSENHHQLLRHPPPVNATLPFIYFHLHKHHHHLFSKVLQYIAFILYPSFCHSTKHKKGWPLILVVGVDSVAVVVVRDLVGQLSVAVMEDQGGGGGIAIAKSQGSDCLRFQALTYQVP
ncbi:hypothetical protein QVD17_10245 [Tagetes erecta]|uniref:Uncharacterized protein n=1 Tax=Tagetes erecta TaxID=13708 RepID=A0AAD8NZB0_TARER|nr:hypothetical protein QVD17_10245 [Tagetes erecta]